MAMQLREMRAQNPLHECSRRLYLNSHVLESTQMSSPKSECLIRVSEGKAEAAYSKLQAQGPPESLVVPSPLTAFTPWRLLITPRGPYPVLTGDHLPVVTVLCSSLRWHTASSRLTPSSLSSAH